MKALYVTSPEWAERDAVLSQLAWLAPALDVRSVTGTRAALAELRNTGGFRAVFLSPTLAPTDGRTLIAELRRGRAPVAIVAIVTDEQQALPAGAVASHADHVLVLGDEGVISSASGVSDPGEEVTTVSGSRRRQLASALHGILMPEDSGENRSPNGRRPDPDEGPRFDDDPFAPAADTVRAEAEVDALSQALTEEREHRLALEDTLRLVEARARGRIQTLETELWRARTEFEERLADRATRAAGDNREALAETLSLAEARIAELTRNADRARDALDSLRSEHTRLVEAGAFDRALRDRDRDELIAVKQALRKERRQLVDLEAGHRAARRKLEEQLALAADRLHMIANESQVLQTRLDNELAAQNADRNRIADNALVGWAVMTLDGRLTRCSQTFARMFGYPTAGDAVAASRDGGFSGTPDHARIVHGLENGASFDRVESTARRADGRPFKILTSAVLRPAAGGEPVLIERFVADLSDRTAIEAELRLARRLESAGRLAAAMAPEIEAALVAMESAHDRRPSEALWSLAPLVRQLLAHCRRQAAPAGFLSLNDAIARAELRLRQLAGDGIDLRIRLEDTDTVVAGEDDIESLLDGMILAAAACLPYGGSVVVASGRAELSDLVEGNEIAVSISGFGRLAVDVPSPLVRLAARCGALVRTSGGAHAPFTLHIVFP